MSKYESGLKFLYRALRFPEIHNLLETRAVWIKMFILGEGMMQYEFLTFKFSHFSSLICFLQCHYMSKTLRNNKLDLISF